MRMGAEMQFTASSSDIPAIQAAVKTHGMRFVSDPAKWMSMPRQSVIVGADDMANFNAGCAAIHEIIDPPKQAVEASKPWWRRLLG